MTESLAGELKQMCIICVFYSTINCFLHAQYKALHKSVEQVYGAGSLGEVSVVQLLHNFWSTKEALGVNFKKTWVRLNPNSPMSFISDIKNEETNRVIVITA